MFLGEIVNFDSGYRIGVHMQSRWENYCRTVTVPSEVPLFYGVRQFARIFDLIAKYERELG